jgi:hypothetical protein
VADRGAFLDQKLKNGYIYMAKPATGAGSANIGPSNYSPDHSSQTSTAPRNVMSKAERFGAAEKIFISKKHSKAMPSIESPGPIYRPTVSNLGVGEAAEIHRNSTVTAPGQWCP